MTDFNILSSKKRNPSEAVGSIKSFRQNNAHNNNFTVNDYNVNEFEHFLNLSEIHNSQLKDQDEIQFDNISNIKENNGRPKKSKVLENSKDSSICYHFPKSKYKDSDKEIFYLKNKNEKEENTKENLNQKEKENSDKINENKKEENTFIKKEKKVFNIKIKKDKNIMEYNKEREEKEKEKKLLNSVKKKDKILLKLKIKKIKIILLN